MEMGFLDEIGKKVADVGQKTKEISDVAHINSLITQEVNKMNSIYNQIGKLYMSIHKNDCEEKFLEMVSMVAVSEQNVMEYKKQIQDIKGVLCCAQCGAEVQRGVAFCSSCGNAMHEAVAQMNTDDYVKCPDCGNTVGKEVRFCTFCGKPMKQLMDISEESRSSAISEFEVHSGIIEKHCPNCGAKLADDFAFCTQCGTKL